MFATERDLLVEGLNFQYNKTGFILGSNSPEKPPPYCIQGLSSACDITVEVQKSSALGMGFDFLSIFLTTQLFFCLESFSILAFNSIKTG